MKPDVLFWFYKNFDVCRERLAGIRSLNPDVKIYALYGGDLRSALDAERTVAHFADDFYAFPEDRSAQWKWFHGDYLIARWFTDRGSRLDWDTLFVHQWDMLTTAPLDSLCATLSPGHLLVSGFRPMFEVSAWWPWAGRPQLPPFQHFLRRKYGYDGPLYACLFIVACLPRRFLEGYVEAAQSLTGFLEYKIPTMARVLDVPVCTDHPYSPWWRANPMTANAPSADRILNAVGDEVAPATIESELSKPCGARVFHPVFR